MYGLKGSPNGEGIRNHVTIVNSNNHSAMVIPKGRPTMLTKVQNNGVTIPVTEKMRGYLASQGIYLKKTTIAIKIPGRNALERAIESSKEESINNLQIRLNQWLKDK